MFQRVVAVRIDNDREDRFGSWRDELAVSETGPQHLSERNSLAPSMASGSCHNRTHAVQQTLRSGSGFRSPWHQYPEYDRNEE